MTRKFARPVLAALIGVIFTFFLVESAIRLAGSFHFSEAKVIEGNDSEFRIVCLGNSHTYGFGVPKGKAYADVLNDFLRSERPGFPIRVVNHGLGNANTYNVQKQLERVLPVERPDLVLMMVGEPNYWNKEGYEIFLIEKEGYIPDASGAVVHFLSKSRLIRWLLMLRYENRMGKLTSEQTTERQAYTFMGKYFLLFTQQTMPAAKAEELKSVLSEFLEVRKKNHPLAIREFLIMRSRLEWFHYGNYQRGIDHLEESFRLYPIRQNPLAVVSTLVFLQSAKDPEAIKRLKKIHLEIGKVMRPEEIKNLIAIFSGNYKLFKDDPIIPVLEATRKLIPAAPQLHLHLADYYKNNGDVMKAVEVASELVLANPLQQHAAGIYNYFSFESIEKYPPEAKALAMKTRKEFLTQFPTEAYLMKGEEEDKVGEWISWGIGEIARTSRQANAEVVVQSYHWLREDYLIKNKLQAAIEAGARLSKAHYLDHSEIFRSEIEGQDVTSFYISMPGVPATDNHPSEKGHRMIARMIYDYLNKNGLLPRELRDLDSRKLYTYKSEVK